MSTHINLLPDLRQAKLREKRRRQLVTGVSIAVWVVCGGLILALGIYSAGQKVIIDGYTKSIDDKKDQLSKTPGLIDAMTAQQHLAALPGLYGNRAYITKFLKVFSQADPVDVVLSSVTVDEQNLLTVAGEGKSYATVAKLARALEASNVEVGEGAAPGNNPYFSSVRITSVSHTGANAVGFSLSATVQPEATHGN